MMLKLPENHIPRHTRVRDWYSRSPVCRYKCERSWLEDSSSAGLSIERARVRIPCPLEVWAFSFSQRRPSSLSRINEYLAIDSGWNVNEKFSRVIDAWPECFPEKLSCYWNEQLLPPFPHLRCPPPPAPERRCSTGQPAVGRWWHHPVSPRLSTRCRSWGVQLVVGRPP